MTAESVEVDQLPSAKLQLLTEFVMHNPELADLEDHLRQFNIFEAVGMQTQEIRHSNFLAFLLDPDQPHGFGDAFLKRILQRALVQAAPSDLPINAVSLHLWSLADTIVERERDNIDIILTNRDLKLAIIVENKISAGEHNNQLSRYYRTIATRHPDWRIIALFLSRDNTVPSDARYIPLSYTDVADVLDELVRSRDSSIGDDVRTLIQHYIRMVRRYIVSDQEIAKLCLGIYGKHRRAIDLILKHLPDRQTLLNQAFVTMIEATPGLNVRWQRRLEMGFNPEEWEVPALHYLDGEKAPSLLLQFHLSNDPHKIKIVLWVRPGPTLPRQRLFDMATNHRPPFKPQSKVLNKGWNSVLAVILASKSEIELESTELIQRVSGRWDDFAANTLPAILAVVQQQDWIWSTDSSFELDSDTVLDVAREEDGDEE